MQQTVTDTQIQDALPYAAELFDGLKAEYRASLARRIRNRSLRDFYTPRVLEALSDFEKDIFADVVRARMRVLAAKSMDCASMNVQYGLKILTAIGHTADDAFKADIAKTLQDNALRRVRTSRRAVTAFRSVSQLSRTLPALGIQLDAQSADALQAAIGRKLKNTLKGSKNLHMSEMHQSVVASTRALGDIARPASAKDTAKTMDNVTAHLFKTIAQTESHSDIARSVDIGVELIKGMGGTVDDALRGKLYTSILGKALSDVEGGKTRETPEAIQAQTQKTLQSIGVSAFDAACAGMLFPRAQFKAEMAAYRKSFGLRA